MGDSTIETENKLVKSISKKEEENLHPPQLADILLAELVAHRHLADDLLDRILQVRALTVVGGVD